MKRSKGQASTGRHPLVASIRSVCYQHYHALTSSLDQLWHAPWSTLLTILVIGIALALPTAFFVFLNNAQHLSEGWHNQPKITVFLTQDIREDQVDALADKLRLLPSLKQVKVITPEEGLREFQYESGFGEVFRELQVNPLPAAMEITPTTEAQTPGELDRLARTLKDYPEVDMVQLDIEWIKRLYAMLLLAKRGIYAMAALLGFGVLLIIGNTIRLTTRNHQEEITVMQLVGATSRFILRPFLYTGILYGLLGSIIAWALLNSTLLWLQRPIAALSTLYQSHFHLASLSVGQSALLLLAGGVLGFLGAWGALARRLKVSI